LTSLCKEVGACRGEDRPSWEWIGVAAKQVRLRVLRVVETSKRSEEPSQFRRISCDSKTRLGARVAHRATARGGRRECRSGERPKLWVSIRKLLWVWELLWVRELPVLRIELFW